MNYLYIKLEHGINYVVYVCIDPFHMSQFKYRSSRDVCTSCRLILKNATYDGNEYSSWNFQSTKTFGNCCCCPDGWLSSSFRWCCFAHMDKSKQIKGNTLAVGNATPKNVGLIKTMNTVIFPVKYVWHIQANLIKYPCHFQIFR